jgi:hypothetical protein
MESSSAWPDRNAGYKSDWRASRSDDEHRGYVLSLR